MLHRGRIVITVFSHYYESAPRNINYDERTGIGYSTLEYRSPVCIQDTTRIILPKRPKETLTFHSYPAFTDSVKVPWSTYRWDGIIQVDSTNTWKWWNDDTKGTLEIK